jgi:hypothetical protein
MPKRDSTTFPSDVEAKKARKSKADSLAGAQNNVPQIPTLSKKDLEALPDASLLAHLLTLQFAYVELHSSIANGAKATPQAVTVENPAKVKEDA